MEGVKEMMKIYRLARKQFLPISLSEAWDFFSSPKNLGKITPSRMNFQIISQSGGERMHEGQIIRYKVTVLPFVRLTWVTEITGVKEGQSFSDEQRKGPYRLWRHTHTFREQAGGVEMTDVVEYSLPFGLLGHLAHWLFVEREVNRIFDYRFSVLQTYFQKP
jgi:ligand-binding SRPBCC domain-containing protein